MNSRMSMKKNKKSYHHGDLKTALIAAGMEMLEKEGLQGLTLRAIAAKVGVSHTAPKNHFVSLKGLLTAIGTEGFRRHAKLMQEGLDENSSAEAQMMTALKGYVSFAERHPALFQMMFSPHHIDFSDKNLLKEARGSYAVLERIATGLDWDKAGLPRAQMRAEMMIWSLAHGYAMLRITGQFQDDWNENEPIPVEGVVPKFPFKDGPE